MCMYGNLYTVQVCVHPFSHFPIVVLQLSLIETFTLLPTKDNIKGLKCGKDFFKDLYFIHNEFTVGKNHSEGTSGNVGGMYEGGSKDELTRGVVYGSKLYDM